MKAAVLHEYGPATNLKYEDVPDPDPAEGEVLVRVAAASINPIDYKVRAGHAQSFYPVEFPVILGCDLSGPAICRSCSKTSWNERFHNSQNFSVLT